MDESFDHDAPIIQRVAALELTFGMNLSLDGYIAAPVNDLR